MDICANSNSQPSLAMPLSPETNRNRILDGLVAICDDLDLMVGRGFGGLTTREVEGADAKLRRIADSIQRARHSLDPSRHEAISISLGRPDAVSRFFAFSFIERNQECLAAISEAKFHGSGVYAIYYAGQNISAYLPLSGTETPIYVGKAVPKDPSAETAFSQGPALWSRLREHRKSIIAGGLDPADFRFRRAIIQSGMESAVEDFMIRFFKPIWNREIKLCYGIGKHGDSAQTRKNKRSPWDTMHPGRPWATDTAENQQPRDAIIQALADHFQSNPPVQSKQQLHRLLALL